MSDSELIIDISVDASSAHKELPRTRNEIKDVGDEAENTDKRGRGLGGMFDLLGKGALVAGGGILALGGFLVGAAKAASDEQVGMDRLYGTVKNSIAGWDGNTAAIEKHISSMEKLAFSDDEARDSLNFLVGQTKDLKEAQELQATAADLARAKGIDLMTATKAVGKVDNESIGILKKLGIEVTDQMTKEEALAAIRKTTAGQAETYANSAAGSMSRLQTSLGNAFETIGGAVLNLVSGPLQAIADWFSSEEVQAGIQQAADFIGGALSNAFTFLGQVVNTVWPIIQPFVQNFIDFLKTIASGGDPFAALGTYLSNLATLIGNALPGIVAQLGTWATALWQWIVDAWPGVVSALGTFIQGVWDWIVANGPTILTNLATWTTAFFNWVWNDALPALMGALGGLIQNVWTWITTNGPGILTQLGTWTTAFFNWVWTDALPTLLTALGGLITNVWTWITTNGPTILTQLATWTTAFFNWVWNDVLPKLPGWLANIVSAVWNFITTNGPTILAKLGEWTTAFFNWVMTDVLPKIPGWLGSIATALWTWITTTASDLGSKLFNEWLPALWNWITGPGGVIETLPGKLGEIATGIWTWITTTAASALTKAIDIGKGILDGIMSGLGGAFKAIYDFLIGVATKVWEAIVAFFTGGANGEAEKVLYPGKGKATGGPVRSGVPYLVGERGPEMFVPNSSGTIVPNGQLGGGAIEVNVYLDGVRMSAGQLAEQLGLDLRVTAART